MRLEINRVEGLRNDLCLRPVDYRPDGTSAIAFILKGPMITDLPGGSVSYTVV